MTSARATKALLHALSAGAPLGASLEIAAHATDDDALATALRRAASDLEGAGQSRVESLLKKVPLDPPVVGALLASAGPPRIQTTATLALQALAPRAPHHPSLVPSGLLAPTSLLVFVTSAVLRVRLSGKLG